MDDCMTERTEISEREGCSVGQRKYVVPEGYMVDETEFIEDIIIGL